MTEWSKSTWRNLPRVQMPEYTDSAALAAAEAKLSSYPPLVFATGPLLGSGLRFGLGFGLALASTLA